MSKKKNPKNKALNEFRFNNTTGYPDYVFEESNNKFRSLGLTHNESTFGRKNMRFAFSDILNVKAKIRNYKKRRKRRKRQKITSN